MYPTPFIWKYVIQFISVPLDSFHFHSVIWLLAILHFYWKRLLVQQYRHYHSQHHFISHCSFHISLPLAFPSLYGCSRASLLREEEIFWENSQTSVFHYLASLASYPFLPCPPHLLFFWIWKPKAEGCTNPDIILWLWCDFVLAFELRGKTTNPTQFLALPFPRFTHSLRSFLWRWILKEIRPLHSHPPVPIPEYKFSHAHNISALPHQTEHFAIILQREWIHRRRSRRKDGKSKASTIWGCFI